MCLPSPQLVILINFVGGPYMYVHFLLALGLSALYCVIS